MLPSSLELENAVVTTLAHIAEMVGATLGPGGRHVLIERQEMGMKPIVSKDGVTVFKHLGYQSASRQLILEAARDAATRTASEAGDGTTTATILSSAIASATADVVKANPRVSPQRIVREMEALVPAIMKKIDSYKLYVDSENYASVLLKVATLSANGDNELASAVIEALDTVGEEGNMTIVESSGNSRYSIERIHGYTVELGYEESCRNFGSGFINDKSGTQVNLEAPVFILFDGVVNDIMQVFPALQALGGQFEKTARVNRGIVLVAHGFSDSFLGDLSFNWNSPQSTAKVFPLLTPQSAIHNARTNFLYDLQAYVGVPVFNPTDRPVSDLDPEKMTDNCRAISFECNRFRSSIFAKEDIDAIQLRVDELKEHLKAPESEYEAKDLQVRIGKLTSGIARLNISAPSSSETREKRDRAEDAWMAIKGASKHGALPGGGYVLVQLSADLFNAEKELQVSPKKLALLILATSLLKPVEVLYRNYGYSDEETKSQIVKLLNSDNQTFDISEQKWVDKFDILDSGPAVIEAIRNSISIASLLGTVGGIIAFKRDTEEDRKEADLVRKFETAIGERGSVNVQN